MLEKPDWNNIEYTGSIRRSFTLEQVTPTHSQVTHRNPIRPFPY